MTATNRRDFLGRVAGATIALPAIALPAVAVGSQADNSPRNLSIPSEREAEKRDILKRLLALGWREGMEPHTLFISMWSALEDKNRPDVYADGLAMLEDGRRVKDIKAYIHNRMYAV